MFEIPNGWEQKSLCEVASPNLNSFVDGPFGSNLKTDEYTSEGVRLIQLQNIGEGIWLDENKKFISDRKLDQLSRHTAYPGDIAIAKMADPVARACLLPPVTEKFLVVADCIKLTPDKTRFDSRYLVYAINHQNVRLQAEQKSIGTTRKRINLSVLKTLKIWIPPLTEQECISDILDTLDETIAHTEALIQKLKQIKAGLLHDLLTCGLDENGELRDAIAHPEKFKDSPLGRIPKDWEVLNLELLLNGRPKNGYSPKEVDEWTGTLMLGLGCLAEEGFEPCQLKNAPLNDLKVREALLSDGDFLLSRSNTRDRVALAGIYRNIGVPCIYPDLMMRLSLNDKSSNRFLELLLQHSPVRRQLTGNAQGTSGSMVKITSQTVINIVVALPDHTEQARIIKGIDRYDNRIRAEEAYLNKLKLQKKGLMHDLLTGKVRVNEIKQ